MQKHADKTAPYSLPQETRGKTSRWVLGICREYLRKLIAAQNERAA